MWYAARIVMKCSVENQQSDYLFDEQVRLIQATSHEEAYQKALALGKSEEQQYQNENKKTVTWSFAGLFDLDTVDKLEDGVEITSKRFQANSISDIVVSKEELTVFWLESNKSKTARDILDENDTGDH